MKQVKFKTDTKSMKWRPKLKVYGGGKNTFDPESFEARSYNWWVYVKKIKGKVVFNDHNYSMTTCGHQCDMRRLLKELGIKIDLVVDMRSSLSSFNSEALEPLYREMYQLEIEMNRRGSKADTNAKRVKRIEALKDSVKVARKLGAEFSKDDMARLKTNLVNAETSRVAEAKVEREAIKQVLNRDKQLTTNVEAVNFRL